jgi:hypothetical protein
VGVSGRVKLQIESIIVIKIYPALSAAVGGWESWDGLQESHLDDVFYK